MKKKKKYTDDGGNQFPFNVIHVIQTVGDHF